MFDGRILWIFSFSFMDSCIVFLMLEVKIYLYMCLVIFVENNDNENLIESINRFLKDFNFILDYVDFIFVYIYKFILFIF